MIATDMRRRVYDLMQEGKSRQEIIDYMVARYGNFVTYDPPLTPLACAGSRCRRTPRFAARAPGGAFTCRAWLWRWSWPPSVTHRPAAIRR